MKIEKEIIIDIIEGLNTKILKLESKLLMSCDCSECEKTFPDIKSRIDGLKTIVNFFEKNEEKISDIKNNGYYLNVEIKMENNTPIAEYELIYIS